MDEKIKICHIANSDKTVKFLLLPQLKFLKELGYEVHSVFLGEKWRKDIEKEGIKTKEIGFKRKFFTPFSDFISFLKLVFYFKKEKFFIIHTHNPKPGFFGQIAAKLVRVPIIINTVHGFYFTENSPFLKRKFFIFLEKIAGKCSEIVFFQSREDINTAKEERIIKEEKIRYLGNGVDIERFKPDNFSLEFILKTKKEFNIPLDYKIIGMVGRLVREKGYIELFKAFKEVLSKFPQTLLLIVGSEEPEKKDAINPQIVKNYGIEKNVIFLGEIEKMEEIYPLMDLFVLPSHREGLPRSLLEALAMELPVVATDIRGCKEVIENGKDGILVPVKNPEELSKALIFLLENPKIAKEMGKKGRIKIIEEFDERFVFDRIREEYERLINRHKNENWVCS